VNTDKSTRPIYTCYRDVLYYTRQSQIWVSNTTEFYDQRCALHEVGKNKSGHQSTSPASIVTDKWTVFCGCWESIAAPPLLMDVHQLHLDLGLVHGPLKIVFICQGRAQLCIITSDRRHISVSTKFSQLARVCYRQCNSETLRKAI